MQSFASAVVDAVDCASRSGGWIGPVVHGLDSMSFECIVRCGKHISNWRSVDIAVS